MQPSPFPEPFEMVFSGNGYDKTLHMQRTPHKSLYTQRFESVEKAPLSVGYYIDVHEKKFTITFNLCMKNVKTVLEVLSAYEIYNAFMDGKGKIGGIQFSESIQSSEKKISQETIDFWGKLYKLENVFGISFDIKDGITVGDARCVEEIYRCIVQKKPYKTYKQYNSVKGKSIPKDLCNNMPIEKEIFFEFKAYGHYELLGQTIELKGVCGIFGASIKNMVPVDSSGDGEITMMLQPAEGKRMYESVMLFLTDEDVEKFRKNKDRIKLMENAEEITLLE